MSSRRTWRPAPRRSKPCARSSKKPAALEASVLGNAGEIFGLALYDRPGSVAKLALHLRQWRHEPNLQLDGQTPCEAVARAGSRRKLHALLREAELGLGEAERQVFAAMRAELGLDDVGERARVTDEVRMTAKISGRLTELATPLLMGATQDAEAEAMFRVAAEVWNAGTAAGDGEVDRQKLLGQAREVLDEHELEVDARELEAWVDALVPMRRHYDDPRYMELAIAPPLAVEINRPCTDAIAGLTSRYIGKAMYISNFL